jgi:Tfp pilus assembly protein PilO
MTSTTTMHRTFLCFIGLVLSIYAVYVEHKIESIEHKKAMARETQQQQQQQQQQQDELPSFMLENENVEEEFVALCDIEAIGASCRYVLFWWYL